MKTKRITRYLQELKAYKKRSLHPQPTKDLYRGLVRRYDHTKVKPKTAVNDMIHRRIMINYLGKNGRWTTPEEFAIVKENVRRSRIACKKVMIEQNGKLISYLIKRLKG